MESTRSFCSRCGTPLLYERKRSPHMVNIPRALFAGRTGRELAITWPSKSFRIGPTQASGLSPSRAIPVSSGNRPKSRRRPRDVDDLEFLDRRVPSARARMVP